MSKYLTIFNTEAQWQAAQDTLDYPNVSLIDTTGELHYTTYPGQEVNDAAFGDILICDLSTKKHFYVSPDDYSDAEYKNSQFWPIGVCIYDKASNPENRTIFLIRIPSSSSDYKAFIITNGQYKFSQTALTDDDLVYTSKNNNVSSININNYFRNKLTEITPDIYLETDSYSDAQTKRTTISNYNYPIIYTAAHFVGFGFNKGDLLIPSYNDMYKAFDSTVENQHIIGESFDKIGVTPNFGFSTCTSHTSNPKYNVYSFN